MSNEIPIHPLQAMVNGMNAEWQRERAKTQMTLGALVKALEALPPDIKVVGLGEPMSYRGYYCDLAFAPDAEAVPAAQVLARARFCMGMVFEGYKGGEYMMGASTPVWSADYSFCGKRIMGLREADGAATLVLAEEE